MSDEYKKVVERTYDIQCDEPSASIVSEDGKYVRTVIEDAPEVECEPNPVLSSATVKLAPPLCDTSVCTAPATCGFVDDSGVIISQRCMDCYENIELLLALMSRMVKTGVPQEVAGEWAMAAVQKLERR